MTRPMPRSTAIDTFGSYIEITEETKIDFNRKGYPVPRVNLVLNEVLGTYNPDVHSVFENTPEGEMEAKSYAYRFRLREYEEAIKIRENAIKYSTNPFRMMMKTLKGKGAVLKEGLKAVREEIESYNRSMMFDDPDNIQIRRIPDYINVDTFLNVGTKLFILEVFMSRSAHNRHVIKLHETEVTRVQAFRRTMDEEVGSAAMMYYTNDNGRDCTITSENINNIIGTVEIPTNVIGERLFLTREAAVAAAHEFANEVIATIN